MGGNRHSGTAVQPTTNCGKRREITDPDRPGLWAHSAATCTDLVSLHGLLDHDRGCDVQGLTGIVPFTMPWCTGDQFLAPDDARLWDVLGRASMSLRIVMTGGLTGLQIECGAGPKRYRSQRWLLGAHSTVIGCRASHCSAVWAGRHPVRNGLFGLGSPTDQNRRDSR